MSTKDKDYDKNLKHDHDANPDPLTGQPGSHPVGTGVGAAGAGAVGAAIGGAVGGPIGAVVGSVIGATAGGLTGKGVAEKIDPTTEDEYWQNNYNTRPYVNQDETYDRYQPAYRAGYEGYGRYGTGTGTEGTTVVSFDDAEPHLRRDYESNHGGSGVGWDKAKHAARDAWDRVADALPGDQQPNRREVR